MDLKTHSVETFVFFNGHGHVQRKDAGKSETHLKKETLCFGLDCLTV
jgi:hypothetical protein